MKRILLNLAFLLIILTIICFAVERFRPKPVSQPDVFIYLIDALRADHLGCYGYDRPTSPRIDAFAQEAVLFEQAQTTVTWTRAAVTSLLTGLYSSAHGVMYKTNKLDSNLTTLSEVLKKSGYQTCAITTNTQVRRKFGLGQGFDRFEFENLQTPDWVNKRVEAFLSKARPDSPIFMYLHSIEPHAPYAPQPDTFSRFDRGFNGSCDGSMKALKRLKETKWFDPNPSPDDIGHLIDLYDAEIFDNDAGFGEFLSLLRKSGRYDNALIILVSDHGEAFREHGMITNGKILNKEVMHIPLIIRFPNDRFAGRRFEQPVSLIDIFPTIIAQTNCVPEIDYELPGINLGRALVDEGFGQHRSVYAELTRFETGKFKQLAVLNGRGYKRIFEAPWNGEQSIPEPCTGFWDIRIDPYEQTDLSPRLREYCDEETERLLLWHKKQLTWRKDVETPNVTLSEKDRRELRALGYLH